jgi:hypothetical protein
MPRPALPPKLPDWNDDDELAAFVENELECDQAEADFELQMRHEESPLTWADLFKPAKGEQQAREREEREVVAKAKEGDFFALANLLRQYPIHRKPPEWFKAKLDNATVKQIEGLELSPELLAAIEAEGNEPRTVTLTNEAWALIADRLIGKARASRGRPSRQTGKERRAVNPVHDAADAVPRIRSILKASYPGRRPGELQDRAIDLAAKLHGIKRKLLANYVKRPKGDRRRA